MEFKIGDKVGFKFDNRTGVVKDKFKSDHDNTVYLIIIDAMEEMFCFENELRQIATKYTYEIEHVDNTVVARLYEVKGDVKTEIAIGHGHIMHEGVLGVAQAASYALKRIYMNLGGEF